MDLPALRKRLDLTQAKLAERLGVSPGYVADIERGHRPLTLELAAKLERLSGEGGIVQAVVDERIGGHA